jgi:enamine deaminase RidA (YjgF/YER057c/UK114 family)
VTGGAALAVSDPPPARAVRAGDLLFVSGCLGVDQAGSPAGDVRAQATLAFDALESLLAEHGGSLADVLDVMSFHAVPATIDDALDVARDRFGPAYPAWTAVASTGLPAHEALLSVRAVAHLGRGRKDCLELDGAPWLRDQPSSAACRKGELVFVSGQFGADDEGRPLPPGDHAAQARAAYGRVREALAAASASMDDVVDICSFHVDPRGMVPCERVHMETWAGVEPAAAPTWTAIGVPALLQPGLLAQYRVIADTSPGPRVGRVSASIHWKDTPNAGASRKEGGRLVGIAGEVASDGEGNVTTPGDTRAQARYALRRIQEVVELQGGSMADVVEVTSFHKDPRAWPIVLEAADEFFEPDAGPAWTPVGAVGLWNPGYLHEIYALAVL